MASSHRVRCINKADRSNPHERIRNIGGVNDDRSLWKLSQPATVRDIESGKYSFYVGQPAGDRVALVVAVSAAGNKYLKTRADGDQPNNLLALPECP